MQAGNAVSCNVAQWLGGGSPPYWADATERDFELSG